MKETSSERLGLRGRLALLESTLRLLGTANATGLITAGAAFHAFPQAASASYINMVKLTAILFLSGICAFIVAYVFWFMSTVKIDLSLHEPGEDLRLEHILWNRTKSMEEYRESGKKKFSGAALVGFLSFICLVAGLATGLIAILSITP